MHYKLYFLFLLSKYITCKNITSQPLNSSAIPTGASGNDSQVRILRGFPCSTADHPFMVLLLKKVGYSRWNRLCGGSILNAYWILTAAHCIGDIEGRYAILVSINHGIRGPEVIFVTDIVLHPYFDPIDVSNDIAMLMLKRRLQESDQVEYVKLPRLNSGFRQDPPCQNGLIMGWGVTESRVPKLEELQCALVPVLSSTNCQSIYHSNHRVDIYAYHICTLSTEGVDACQGDSGGPLLCGSVQVGIVSWGIDCGQPQSPGVYTRVDHYLDFILDTMNSNAMVCYPNIYYILYLVFIKSWIAII